MRFLCGPIQDPTISGEQTRHIVSPKHKNDAHYGDNNAHVNLNHCDVELKVEFGTANNRLHF